MRVHRHKLLLSLTNWGVWSPTLYYFFALAEWCLPSSHLQPIGGGDKKVAALVQFARCQEVRVSGEYEKLGTRRRAPDLISGDQRGLPGGKDN